MRFSCSACACSCGWLGYGLNILSHLCECSRVVAVAMTVLGVVMTLLSVPRSVGEIAPIHIAVGVLSLVLILAWVLLTVIGTLSAVLKSARTLKAASQLMS